MKKYILAILLLSALPCISQNLSQKEATKIVEKWEEIGILNKNGVNYFKKFIKTGEFERDGIVDLVDGTTPSHENLKKSTLYQQLALVFGDEFVYRSGEFLFDDLYGEIDMVDYDIQDTIGYQKLQQRIDSIVELRFKTFEPAIMESKIPYDPQIDTTKLGGYFTLDFGFPSTNDSKKDGKISYKYSAFGKTYYSLIEDLFDAGLIDQKIKENVINYLNTGYSQLPTVNYYLENFLSPTSQGFMYESFVMLIIASSLEYYEDLAYNKSRELKYFNRLIEVNLLTKNVLDTIESYHNKDLLYRYSNYFANIENAYVFSFQELPDNPAEGFNQLYQEISKKIPEFDISNCETTIELTDSEFGGEFVCRMNMNINGSSYYNEFNYSFYDDELQTEPDKINYIEEKYLFPLNQYLVDSKSPYRVHLLGGGLDEKEFILLLMTEKQARAFYPLRSGYLYDFLYCNNMTTEEKSEQMKQLEELGVLDHLTKKEIEKGQNKVKGYFTCDTSVLLSAFPKSIVEFDYEMWFLDQPYKDFIERIGELDSNLSITNIEDDFFEDVQLDKSKSNVKYTINGKSINQEIEIQSDWYDREFMHSFAIEVEKAIGKKLYIYSDYGILLLNEEQASFFQENNQNQLTLFTNF